MNICDISDPNIDIKYDTKVKQITKITKNFDIDSLDGNDKHALMSCIWKVNDYCNGKYPFTRYINICNKNVKIKIDKI